MACPPQDLIKQIPENVNTPASASADPLLINGQSASSMAARWSCVFVLVFCPIGDVCTGPGLRLTPHSSTIHAVTAPLSVGQAMCPFQQDTRELLHTNTHTSQGLHGALRLTRPLKKSKLHTECDQPCAVASIKYAMHSSVAA